ncbi:MAG: methylenetetrahydrofolate reductase [Woeseiaceae bacterium]
MQTFRHALRTQDFSLTAELALGPASTAASIVAQARVLADHVDAIQVADGSADHAHMSVVAAGAILVNAGIDPVLHFNCRDRNRLALRADVLGAAALGISGLLLMRGAELPTEARPQIKPVYDWGTHKLITFARSLENANFLLGSIATAFKPDRDWQPERLGKRADAGVNFIQTQLCFDGDLLRHYMSRIVAAKLTHRVSVLVGLAPLPSADAAQWLGKNLRGAVVPAKVVKRLRQAKDPELEGVTLCAEILRSIAEVPGVSGANLVCMGEPEAVAESVRLSGIRRC